MRQADFVVVGAGSAGCALAARLAERGFEVVVLEAATIARSPFIDVPGGVLFMVGNPRFDWRYAVEPDASLGGRAGRWAAGRAVGGSSAINGMVFSPGLAADYDEWEAGGATGWGAADVLPWIRRLERAPPNWGAGRGHDGPLSVEGSRSSHPIDERILDAARQAGWAIVEDIATLEGAGIGPAQYTMLRGRRMSAARAFASGLAMCRLIRAATVTRVRLERKRCTGVEYEAADGPGFIAARRAVILCAGTMSSPAILLRSGIGPPGHLQSVGIPVRHELPGVGENLQEHPAVPVSIGIRTPTLNTRTRPLAMAIDGLRWLATRRGPAASSVVHLFGYACSSAGLRRPDLQVQIGPLTWDPARPPFGLARESGVTAQLSVTQPHSRGTLRLRSASLGDPPRIEHALLGDARDVAKLVRGIELLRQLFAQAALQPQRIGERLPGPGVAGEEALRRYCTETAYPCYHPVGTCSMGEGPAAVVSPRLRVHGLQGLYVADASVMPTVTSGNTNVPSIMIGERAAELIPCDCRLESPIP